MTGDPELPDREGDPGPDPAAKPTQADYQARLDRITNIFADMVQHADELSLSRCPYKDRHNHCTAKFGCRFQDRTSVADTIVCTSDDKLDYRTAWDMNPASADKMHKKLRSNRSPRSS